MEKAISAAVRHLRNADPVIKKLIEHHGPCTLYEKDGLLHKSEFHVLCWAIINQQLSVKSAQSIENKLLDRLQSKEFSASGIQSLNDRALAACGLSRQKIRYLRTLCDEVQRRRLQLKRLARYDNEAVFEVLSQLPGIGPWTVDMFLMFSLGRLDVLPLGDLALRKSIHSHYALPDSAQKHDYLAIAERWQPYQSIASWYLWAAVD